MLFLWTVFQVPTEELVPADLEPEIPRSISLPPPIIPETEDFTLDSVREYKSPSRTKDKPLDVYTLSWDLPSSFDSGDEILESGPDEEEDEVTKNLSADLSDHQKTSADVAEKTDLFKPNKTQSESNLSQEEPNQSPSFSVTAEEPAAGPEIQTKSNQDSTTHSIGSKLEISEPRTESVAEQNFEINPESASVEHLDVAAPAEENIEASLPDETQPCDREPGGQVASVVQLQAQQEQAAPERTPDPDPDLIPASTEASAPQEQLAAVPLDINGTPDPPSPLRTKPVHQVPASDSSTLGGLPPLPSKVSLSAANPFKIQKVKSSDLRSFQQIVGQEGSNPPPVDRTSSLGSGLNLSVPSESLEMISDSEEGDEAASAVLPDWLKEGEFVTVGTNKSGTVRFVGPTDFAEGTWVGVELEVPAGKKRCFPGYFCFLTFLASTPSAHLELTEPELVHNIPAFSLIENLFTSLKTFVQL